MTSRRARRLVVKYERIDDPALALVAGRVVRTPQMVALALADYLAGPPARLYEAFMVVYLDVRNRIIGLDEISNAGLSRVFLSPLSVIRNAILSGAVGFITAHNHPTGDPDPSDDDVDLWAKLRDLATTHDLVVLDNLVIGERHYYSEAEGQTLAYRT